MSGEQNVKHRTIMKTKLLRKLRKRARKYAMVVQLRNGGYRILFGGGTVHRIVTDNLVEYKEIVDELRLDEMNRLVRNMKENRRQIKRIVY